MQEPKFTKGPWELDVDPTKTDDFYHEIRAGKGYCCNEYGNGFSITGCMTKEDAQLIATAPDLFNALNPIVDMLNNGILVGFDTPKHKRAIEALNKALGIK